MSASQAPEMGAEAENLQAITTAYLDSFAARDLEGCLRYFADDAVLQFHVSTFRNKKGIEQWHKDRFSADLRLVRIDDMQTEGDTVRVEGVVTSKRLRAWLVNEIEGLEQGLMKHVKFSWNQ
jgi:ketosteroid isomerase-like protein